MQTILGSSLCSSHCPPCRQGVLSHIPTTVWHCLPTKPDKHTQCESSQRPPFRHKPWQLLFLVSQFGPTHPGRQSHRYPPIKFRHERALTQMPVSHSFKSIRQVLPVQPGGQRHWKPWAVSRHVAPWPHGWESQCSTASAQVGPVQPSAHAQLKPVWSSLHVAPFTHGEVRHACSTMLQSRPRNPS